MKKVFILTVAILLCLCSSAYARFGLEAGLNYNFVTMSSDDMNISESGSGMGFHFGGYYNYKLKTGDYLKLGLGFTTRKVKVEASDSGYTYTMEPDMKSWDIAVLYMKQSPKNAALTFMGGLTIVKENDGTVKYTQSGGGYSSSTSDSVDDDDLQMDIFLTGGIKYKYSDTIFPEIKLQYNITPSRDFWDSDTEFSNYFSILFSVAYEFE